jgi:hypothetical protein
VNQSNESLDQINDPVVRAKLAGIQEAVFGIDGDIIQMRRTIEQKQGVIQAAEIIASRLFEECKPIQAAVDAEKMEADEAKIRIEVIQKLVQIVRNIGSENKADLLGLRGQIQGMERAVKRTEERFNGEVTKYERWQRIQAEDAATDPRRRAPPPDSGNGKAVVATEDAPGGTAEAKAAPEAAGPSNGKQKGKPGGNMMKQKAKKPS